MNKKKNQKRNFISTPTRAKTHIRTAVDNRRKHFSQMHGSEINELAYEIETRTFDVRQHAIERAIEKGVARENLNYLLTHDFQIVEANNNRYNDLRVLIRGVGNKNGKELCAVVSLTYNEVVTLYWASNHDYLAIDKSIYAWNVNLTEAIYNRQLLQHPIHLRQAAAAR